MHKLGAILKYIFLILIISSTGAHGFYKEIFEGYKKSKRVQILELNKSIDEYSFLTSKEQFSWNLELESAYSDSYLSGLFSFQSQNTKSQQNSIGISKSSYNWGAISVKQIHTRYDLSNWSQSSLNGLEDDQLYEVKNVVSYQYQFLNNPLRNEWESVFAQKEVSHFENNVSLHKDSLDFFLAYIQAKQLVILDRYYKEFEDRARIRVAKLTKRVRDGLSRSVDKKQAQLSLITQQERVIENKTKLSERILFIEKIVGFPIKASYYKKLAWTFKEKENFKSIFESRTNIELQKLEAALKLAEINLESLNTKNKQSLTLNLEYAKNAINENKTESFELATFGEGRNEEKIIALNYTIPIGGMKAKAIGSQLKLLREQNELKLSDYSEDITNKIKSLENAINSYQKAIKLSKSKISISDEIVNETQSLYLKGSATFEEVLRSEEAYLNARITNTNLLLLLEDSYVNLAFLTGNTFDFLKRYED